MQLFSTFLVGSTYMGGQKGRVQEAGGLPVPLPGQCQSVWTGSLYLSSYERQEAAQALANGKTKYKKCLKTEIELSHQNIFSVFYFLLLDDELRSAMIDLHSNSALHCIIECINIYWDLHWSALVFICVITWCKYVLKCARRPLTFSIIHFWES